MSEELKTILDKLEIVARKHTIEVCEDGSKIETMPANIVDELRLNNYSAKLLLNYIQQKENIIKEIRETLDDKRSILTTHLLNGSYCNYEELLYQVDEEIRKILDKVGDSSN